MLGESEHKILDWFADTRRDQKLYRSDSVLHIIVIDEIDAVCKRHSGHVNGIRYKL